MGRKGVLLFLSLEGGNLSPLEEQNYETGAWTRGWSVKVFGPQSEDWFKTIYFQSRQ